MRIRMLFRGRSHYTRNTGAMQNHSTPQYYHQSESTLSLRAVSEEIYDGIFTVINPVDSAWVLTVHSVCSMRLLLGDSTLHV